MRSTNITEAFVFSLGFHTLYRGIPLGFNAKGSQLLIGCMESVQPVGDLM
jgi:hypothetical protein